MKKIYTLVLALAGATTLLAQNQLVPVKFPTEQPKVIVPTTPVSINQHSSNSVQGTQSFWIDYNLSDFIAGGGTLRSTYPGAGYAQYLWPFNGHYSEKNKVDSTKFGSYMFKHWIVGFDSIYDSNNGIAYDKSQVTSIFIDSLMFTMGQENNSGIDDSVKITIINLANTTYFNSYPGVTTYTVLPIVIAQAGVGLSQTNQFSDPVTIAIPVGFQCGNGVKQFGVKLEYLGNKQDTAALLVGFNDEGGNGSLCYDKPLYSAFTKLTGSGGLNGSTYVWNDYYAVNYNLTDPLPTRLNGNSYVECDGVAGKSTGGLDGNSIIQNANISAKVTITTTGMQELKKTGVSLGQNVPNPFNGNSTINYELADNKNVKLEVFDIAGKRLMNIEEGMQSAGRHSVVINASDLNAGVYFYTLTAGDVRVTKRMTIVE